MKFFFDFFPVLLFFLTYKFFGSVPVELIELANQIPYVSIDHKEPKDAMFLATLVIIIATIVQNILHYYVYRRFEKMHLVSLVLLVILGGATIIMKDPRLLVWKVTVINWLFGLVFLGSQFIGEKPIVERLMGQAFEATKRVWTQLNIAWFIFFIFVGLANLYVYYYSCANPTAPSYCEDSWVNFKFYGLMGATFIFIIAQSIYLMKNGKMIEVEETSENN